MDRLAYWIYRLLSAAIRVLPIIAVFRIGQALGALAYVVGAPYRRLVLRNLEIAFGAEKTIAEQSALAREHFRTLGGNLFSSVKIASMTREEILTVVTVEGAEIVQQLLASGRGCVFPLSHLGNWELFAQLWPVLFQGPMGSLYQRLGNPFIDAEMRAIRARMGVQLFERKEGFQGAIQVLRNAGSVGVLADQHAGDAGVWCPLFGRLASTSPLTAMLALRTGAAIISAAVYSDGPARWRLIIQPPLTPGSRNADEVTAEINLALEAQIRRQPADWFWVHNRWKTPRPKFLLATYKRGVVLGREPSAGSPAPEASTGAPRSPLPAPRPLQPFRIVIRTSNWLGDAVMSVPAVRAIKRGRPDAHVTVLTPAKLADVWKTVAEVDVVLTFLPKESFFSVARTLRAGGFEAAIVFPNSFRTALEPWLADIPRRVGHPGHRRAWLLNQLLRDKKRKKPQPRPPEHQVHHYLRLAEFVGAEVKRGAGSVERGASGSGTSSSFSSSSSASSPTPIGDEEEKEVRPPDAPRSTLHAPRPLRLALCPGAEYGPAKRWLPERFAETMRRVSTVHNCEWLLVGVAKDAPIAEEILRGFTGAVRNLVGETTLAELIAELRRCDLLLTNDTGTMHLAALLGVRVVAIFGSTEPALTGPLGPRHTVLRHHVPCSPCFLRECPLDFRCMHAVTVDEVVEAILAILGRVDGAGAYQDPVIESRRNTFD